MILYRVPRWLWLAVVVLVAAWMGTGVAASARQEQPVELKATLSSFPDYMDPQLSYTYEGWTAMYNTYIPLLTYRHAPGEAGSEVIPGLAKSLPRITHGGRTYTLFLRKGLRYSDGRPVRASDFEFAIERMFKLGSSGFPLYADIVGARRFLRTKRGGISGIVTNNRTGKVVIHLAGPRATFTNELALLFAAPVSPNTPIRDRSFHPPPGTGPYVITRSRLEGWSYERNPYWEANRTPQLPSGHLDRINVAVIRNGSAQVRKVESGALNLMMTPPPSDRYEELKRKYGGTQFRVEPLPSIYYFWMNTRKPPFDDLKVRRAVNYAVDSSALARIYGGALTPTQQILPFGIPGHKKFELYPHNMAKARRLIAEADPSDRRITVWTSTGTPNYEAGAYYQRVLRKLGFNARLKALSGDVYFTVIGNASTPNLDTGWSNWFEDYPHPNDFFQPLFSGSSIHRFNNLNFSQISVPSLDRKIAKLNERAGPILERRYAALDKSYMKLAPVVPYGNRALSTFVSEDVDLDKLIWNPTFGVDLTSLQFRD